MGYSSMELMVAVAARFLEDGRSVVVGTGAPCAAAMLAQRTSAPDLLIMFEAGGFGPILPTMPISVGDSRTYHRGFLAGSMTDVMDFCQQGAVDYTFLGGAQVDMYGNLNSTVVGPWDRPKVRLPGSGGANDLASLCWRTLMITQQDKRRFVPAVDFITTPGYLTGPGAREAVGLPRGTGPYKVITDLCVIGFDQASCRMRVEAVHPGVSPADVEAATGFELLWAQDLAETEPPTPEELRLLREVVDPGRYIIGRS